MTPGRRWGALAVAAVTLARIAASLAALRAGFRAVSDDDFARVVIAEQWARAPRLDPSGTSWLPFPFWITGAVMKVAGRGVDTARWTAAALGVGAALLVYVAARWLGEGRGPAAAGAVAAAVFPWAARLGVATVPELPTAALTVLAMAALAASGRRRMLGGAAIGAAALSRYEAWPAALIFAGVCVVDAARAPEDRAPRLGAAALALSGPSAWIAWNRWAHGDAFHFWARVTGYRQALEATQGKVVGRFWDYPAAMVREEPEIVALLVAAVAILVASGGVAALRARLAPYARPALVAAAQIGALSLAMLKDGAPTHHPERAVLAGLILIALMGGALAAHALSGTRRRLPAAATLALAAALAGVLGRGKGAHESFVQRAGEEAMGRAARSEVRPGEPLLIEVADHGYLAVEAALGRPEDAIPDRTVDPRRAKEASSFADPAALRQRVASSGARWAAARIAEPVISVLGPPVAEEAGWGLFRITERAP